MSFRPGDGGKGSGRRPGNGFGEGHELIFGERKPKPRWVPPRLPDQRCPTCKGNDADMPCAYPSKSAPGCLRDKRLVGKE